MFVHNRGVAKASPPSSNDHDKAWRSIDGLRKHQCQAEQLSKDMLMTKYAVVARQHPVLFIFALLSVQPIGFAGQRISPTGSFIHSPAYQLIATAHRLCGTQDGFPRIAHWRTAPTGTGPPRQFGLERAYQALPFKGTPVRRTFRVRSAGKSLHKPDHRRIARRKTDTPIRTGP